MYSVTNKYKHKRTQKDRNASFIFAPDLCIVLQINTNTNAHKKMGMLASFFHAVSSACLCYDLSPVDYLSCPLNHGTRGITFFAAVCLVAATRNTDCLHLYPVVMDKGDKDFIDNTILCYFV